jgi:Bacterial PH domain
VSEEFDFEAIRGLPGHLPPGERLLWQGAPDWWSVARRVFHLPLIAGYLGLFPAWRIVSAIHDGLPLLELGRSVGIMVLLIAACCCILAALAFAVARTTVYSVTSERVVLRYGIALPMALNLPFSKIEAAAVRAHGGGFGDIPLTLMKDEKLAYLVLWPHARPWRMTRPEPMLRGVPKVAEVAAILGQALASSASRPAARAQAGQAALVPVAVPVQALRPAPSVPRDAPSGEAMPEPIARLA